MSVTGENLPARTKPGSILPGRRFRRNHACRNKCSQTPPVRDVKQTRSRADMSPEAAGPSPARAHVLAIDAVRAIKNRQVIRLAARRSRVTTLPTSPSHSGGPSVPEHKADILIAKAHCGWPDRPALSDTTRAGGSRSDKNPAPYAIQSDATLRSEHTNLPISFSMESAWATASCRCSDPAVERKHPAHAAGPLPDGRRAASRKSRTSSGS